MYHLLTFFIGVFIGIQSAIGGQLGTRMNPLIVGLLAMTMGGLVSILLLPFQPSSISGLRQTISLPIFIAITVSGIIGIIALGGSALVLPHVGLTTGLGLVLLGQIIVSLAGDVFGITGRQIAITPHRIFGVVLLLIAVWLINRT